MKKKTSDALAALTARVKNLENENVKMLVIIGLMKTSFSKRIAKLRRKRKS